MSLIPPNAVMKSKLKYYLQNKLSKEDYDLLVPKLDPFPLFQLTAEFRSLVNGAVVSFDDICEQIDSKTNEFDCIDTCLNMYTRLKKKMKESLTTTGVLRLSIQTRPDVVDSSWSDMYLDEFPVAIEEVKTA